MAALYTRKFGKLEDMQLFLQGGIRGGKKVVQLDGKVFGLHGKTLVFNTPTGTVTFADATNAGLTYKQIVDEIAADVTTVVGRFDGDGRLTILDADLSGPIDLDVTGTANKALGFSTVNDTVGTLYAAPDGSAPRLVTMGGNSQGDGYHVVTEE